MLPRLYEAFLNKEVFTFEDVLELGYSRATARQKIYQLHKQRLIGQIRPGKYYVIPLGGKGEEFVPDRYKVGSVLVRPYFFSHHSALDLHGVAYYVASMVSISSPKQFRPLNLASNRFQGIVTKRLFGIQKVNRGIVEIFVSDPERTFLDGLRRLDLVGGLEQYWKSIEGFPYLKPKRILDYLKMFDEKSLNQRAGFALDYFKEAWDLPSEFLDELASLVSSNVYYLVPSAKGPSKFVKKWNLMVPPNLTS